MKWWCYPLFYPFTLIFRALSGVRRWWLSQFADSLPVPVVVVGNITVGGTGKTPVVIALVHALQARGYNVGVISRGCGSAALAYPFLVSRQTSSRLAGDEALLIAQDTQAPVMIDRHRARAAAALCAKHPELHVLISDDGLQHYSLPRAMEIVVVDGQRALGNGHCLPMGPLREPVSRLAQVHRVLLNGQVATPLSKRVSADVFELIPCAWWKLDGGLRLPLMPIPWSCDDSGADSCRVVAVAAIGNPQRFFCTLQALGVHCRQSVAFDDHYPFQPEDFTNFAQDVVVMTTKDAVKCAQFAQGRQWFALSVQARLAPKLIDDIVDLIPAAP